MRSKLKNIILTIVIIILSIIIVKIYDNKDGSIIKSKSMIKQNTSILSLMYEKENGVYEQSGDTAWSTSGYTFNSELSGCEHGGTLRWNGNTQKIIMESSYSNKCYVYFDKILMLSEYIMTELYTGTDGTNGLYYHDGLGSYTNASEEAEDYSYRFAGSNNVVTKNYVCFGAEVNANGACDTNHLYRIIGLFDDDGDGTYNVKLIKSTWATTTELGTWSYVTNTNQFYWQGSNSSSSNNTWSASGLNNGALNGYYINTYLDRTHNSKWSQMIENHTWKVGGNTWVNIGTQTVKTAYQNEVLNPVTSNSMDNQTTLLAYIGLMYVSDYMYAVAPIGWKTKGFTGGNDDYRGLTTNNWLYTTNYPNDREWTISRYADDADGAFYVPMNGIVYGTSVSYAAGVRPSFYLKSEVKFSGGKGTADEPFVLSI